MPLYTYKNPKTGETKDVLQSMKDTHEYEEDGVAWIRVFIVPNTTIDSQVDPFDKNKFIKKTGNMKGTVGDMMDFSKELSEERANKAGSEDPVKRKFFNDYEKNVGKKHMHDKKKVIQKKGITANLD